jgi:ribosomal protein S18 acetylase RimI-like enzyme
LLPVTVLEENSMSLRPIQLPSDFAALSDILLASFHYPENEAWSVQSDEKEQLVDMIKNLARLWPLIRGIQLLSPSLRDLLVGYIWEQDGKPVGTTIVSRRGSTDVWVIGTVAVMPEARRKGIARQLVEAGIDLIKNNGGEKALLSVIDGNLPAFSLYESLGFEDYSQTIEFQLTPEGTPPETQLPPGYQLSPQDRFDWQPSYELDKRITPERLQRYNPVEDGRYREPAMARVLAPILKIAQGTRDEFFLVRTTSTNKLVARGSYRFPTRGKGVNILSMYVDPDHGEIASALVATMLHRVQTINPGLRIELSVPSWMEAVVAAAEAAGFEKRMTYCQMGLSLE